jgi:hypothetical protein
MQIFPQVELVTNASANKFFALSFRGPERLNAEITAHIFIRQHYSKLIIGLKEDIFTS